MRDGHGHNNITAEALCNGRKLDAKLSQISITVHPCYIVPHNHVTVHSCNFAPIRVFPRFITSYNEITVHPCYIGPFYSDTLLYYPLFQCILIVLLSR